MKNIILGLLTFVLLGIVYFGITNLNPKEMIEENEIVESNGISMTIHKSPYCGCCGMYGDEMTKLGYKVDTVLVDSMEEVKDEFKIPYELQSCHTTEVEGYVVEGHVPEEAIQKLLSEKPDIKGIGMAGMPSGSPGMPGPKEDFMIYEINHDGTKGDLFVKL